MPPAQVPPHGDPPPAPGGDPVAAAKTAVRDRILTTRRRRPLPVRLDVAADLARVLLEAPEVRRAASVAAYVGVGSEPGTGPLLAALLATGKRVLLPVLLPDLDLDWAVHTSDADLGSASRGLLEPTGPRLGIDAIATTDVVLVPGLAVSPTGLRLGRGGGSYDRALARVPVGTFTCVLLYDDEVGLDVPAAPHDRPVTAVATPSGFRRF